MTEENDAMTEQFLRDAARDEGLTYHDFCQKYGIIGPSQARKVRRHELNESDVSSGSHAGIYNRTSWGDSGIRSPNRSVITAKAPDRGMPRRKRDDE